MEINITVELIIYAVTIITSALLYFIAKTGNRKLDFSISLLVLIIGFFIGSYASIRFVYLKQIVENQKFIEDLKKDNEALSIALDLSESKQSMILSYNPFFGYVLNDRKATFQSFLEDFKSKQIVYNKSDFPHFEKDVIKIFTECDNNQVILATSRVDYNQWWKKEDFGEQYTKANFDCIKHKKVTIKRIWIFDDEREKNEHLSTLESQKKAGIETYYVFNKDIKDIVERKRDVIVVGDKYAGELILNERDMSKVVFYFDNKKIEDIKKDWIELSNKSKRF